MSSHIFATNRTIWTTSLDMEAILFNHNHNNNNNNNNNPITSNNKNRSKSNKTKNINDNPTIYDYDSLNYCINSNIDSDNPIYGNYARMKIIHLTDNELIDNYYICQNCFANMNFPYILQNMFNPEMYYCEYRNELLYSALDVGLRLMPAFLESQMGIPFGTVNLRYGVPNNETTVVCTSCAGTYILEFGVLSALLREIAVKQEYFNTISMINSVPIDPEFEQDNQSCNEDDDDDDDDNENDNNRRDSINSNQMDMDDTTLGNSGNDVLLDNDVNVNVNVNDNGNVSDTNENTENIETTKGNKNDDVENRKNRSNNNNSDILSKNQRIDYFRKYRNVIKKEGSFHFDFSIFNKFYRKYHSKFDGFYSIAKRGSLRVYHARTGDKGLLGAHLNNRNGVWTHGDSGLGTYIDSFFEYLLKGYMLFNDFELLTMYNDLLYSLYNHCNAAFYNNFLSQSTIRSLNNAINRRLYPNTYKQQMSQSKSKSKTNSGDESSSDTNNEKIDVNLSAEPKKGTTATTAAATTVSSTKTKKKKSGTIDLKSKNYFKKYDKFDTEHWWLTIGMQDGKPTFNTKTHDSFMSFWPGMFTLTGQFRLATLYLDNILDTIIIDNLLLIPELFDVEHKKPIADSNMYPLRPELIESLFYMIQSHTNDKYYMKIAFDMLKNINNTCRVDCGYARVNDLLTHDLHDSMDSFFLSETLKYFYLLFSVNVDDDCNSNPNSNSNSNSDSNCNYKKNSNLRHWLLNDRDNINILFTTEGHIIPINYIGEKFRNIEKYTNNLNQLYETNAIANSLKNSRKGRKSLLDKLGDGKNHLSYWNLEGQISNMFNSMRDNGFLLFKSQYTADKFARMLYAIHCVFVFLGQFCLFGFRFETFINFVCFVFLFFCRRTIGS